jgi:hypothetical protein
VKHFARFSTPSEIVAIVKENFGIDVVRNHVAYYNGDTNEKLPKVWRDLFEEERESFRKDVAAVPVAHQPVRLQMIQQLLNEERNKGTRRNPVLMMNLLEQAAKEVGGMFTNRRELTGKGGERLVPTAEEIARDVYRELVTKEGLSRQEAMRFVTERYHVPEDALITMVEQ